MPEDIYDYGNPGPGDPGGNAVYAVDIQPSDVLVQAGLVDAGTGRAVETPDWQPTETSQSRYPSLSGETTPTQTQTPATTGATAPGSTPAIDPVPGVALQNRVAELQSQAAEAYAYAIGQGAHPGQTQAILTSALQAEIAKAQLGAVRAASTPVVKQQVAQLIATNHGNGVVKAEDLMTYNDPQAMETAARQLADARRGANFAARAAAGTDRTEGVARAGGLSQAIQDLSPEKKIELGMRRGQYR